MLQLSASRIKTAKSCGLKYYYQYVDKLETSTHPKTAAGSVTHYLLENLAAPKRRAVAEKIIEAQNLFVYPPAFRFGRIWCNKLGITDSFWPGEINELVLAGLAYNFWGDEQEQPTQTYIELPFQIQSGEFAAKGFLDKVFVYERNGEKFAHIVDYKTSGEVFSGVDEYNNVQAHIYSWALHENLGIAIENIKVTFLFLRYRDKPNFALTVDSLSQSRLEGVLSEFSAWQNYLGAISFEESLKACAGNKPVDYAAFFTGPNLCGKLWRTFRDGKTKTGDDGLVLDDVFACEFRLPRVFWREIDESGKIVKNWLDKPAELKENHRIEEYIHGGCEFWKETDKAKLEENWEVLTDRLKENYKLYN